MIYIGNGIYSEATPNEYLQHYGVIGMKWGVRKARIHERNLYRHNRGNGMSRAEAKDLYKKRMAGVKSYARANRGTGMRARDIATNSYNEANKKISNYDAKLKAQKRRKIVAGALGAAALGAAGYGLYKGIKKGGFKDMGKGYNNMRESYRNAEKAKGASTVEKVYNKILEGYKDTASRTVDPMKKAHASSSTNMALDTYRRAKTYGDRAKTYKNLSNNQWNKGYDSWVTGSKKLAPLTYGTYGLAAAGGVALANHIKTKRQMRQGNDTPKGSQRKKR